MTTLRFHDALKQAAQSLQLLLEQKVLPAEPAVRVVRDLYGRLRYAARRDAFGKYRAGQLRGQLHADTDLDGRRCLRQLDEHGTNN